jgi:leucyl aminopeptidase
MEISVTTGDITRATADTIMVGIFEQQKPEGDVLRLDAALEGAISQLVNASEIKGKLNEITVIHTLGKLPTGRIAVIGLGKKEQLTDDKIRAAVAEACRSFQKRGVKTAAIIPLGAGTGTITLQSSAQAITEGAVLGLYTFRKHISKEPETSELNQISIIESNTADLAALQEGVRFGRITAEAANLARDLVNEPANYMTPTNLAESARELARIHQLELTILEQEQVRALGMGAFLGVAQGSQEPPMFIILRYNGRGNPENDIALVGKGITFDSGGISIKPSEGMGDMKGDMAGGASVMAALGAISELKPRINVVAIVAATENMPSGTALKPGDVLKSMSGKTIEIISTDAEGRLTLADAISYARKQNARAIIDIATLTGAMQVALGNICTGAFSNNQDLVNKVVAAGEQAGEHIWQMPMFEEYKEQNKSDVADIKNTGGRPAGSITAAQFLAEFAGDTPWVHLDIAGTSDTDKERGYQIKGATGVPVRTLINLVLAIAKP